MLLAAIRRGKYSQRMRRQGIGAATVSPGPHALTDTAPRPTANENFLLINAFAAQTHSPLAAITKRIADCGCNIAETRVAALGRDVAVIVLAQGPWDAIAKLESALSRLEREEQLRLLHFRTGPKPPQTNLLPYVVEVVAADKPGILFQIAEFFQQHGISIEQLQSTRYRAMQTGADMFSAQITVGIPSSTHIAALRDDFLEFCDGLNLDAIMDPMKY
jgi:glycine cleavage system transcriptional repressor